MSARLSDPIWPPRSLWSEVIVDRPGVIEPPLWAEPDFLADPLCFRCGYPMPEEVSPEAVCSACAAQLTPAPAPLWSTTITPANWCWTGNAPGVATAPRLRRLDGRSGCAVARGN